MGIIFWLAFSQLSLFPSAPCNFHAIMIPLPHMQDHAQMDASTLTPLSSLNYPITNPLPFMMPLVCSVLASFLFGCCWCWGVCILSGSGIRLLWAAFWPSDQWMGSFLGDGQLLDLSEQSRFFVVMPGGIWSWGPAGRGVNFSWILLSLVNTAL